MNIDIKIETYKNLLDRHQQKYISDNIICIDLDNSTISQYIHNKKKYIYSKNNDNDITRIYFNNNANKDAIINNGYFMLENNIIKKYKINVITSNIPFPTQLYIKDNTTEIALNLKHDEDILDEDILDIKNEFIYHMFLSNSFVYYQNNKIYYNEWKNRSEVNTNTIKKDKITTKIINGTRYHIIIKNGIKTIIKNRSYESWLLDKFDGINYKSLIKGLYELYGKCNIITSYFKCATIKKKKHKKSIINLLPLVKNITDKNIDKYSNFNKFVLRYKNTCITPENFPKFIKRLSYTVEKISNEIVNVKYNKIEQVKIQKIYKKLNLMYGTEKDIFKGKNNKYMKLDYDEFVCILPESDTNKQIIINKISVDESKKMSDMEIFLRDVFADIGDEKMFMNKLRELYNKKHSTNILKNTFSMMTKNFLEKTHVEKGTSCKLKMK